MRLDLATALRTFAHDMLVTFPRMVADSFERRGRAMAVITAAAILLDLLIFSGRPGL